MNLSTLFARGQTLDDRLSPILVKELRQGMRGRIFVVSFLLLQAFLFLLVLANLSADSATTVTELQNTYFWTIVGFTLLLLMPLRGLNAISQELKRNTLETIMLTRMTAWRVVFGKWSALFSQSLLFVSAVLPYIALRYFIGGNDVFRDFEALLFMLWLSGLLIASSIAISALANLFIRAVVIFVVGSLYVASIQMDYRVGVTGPASDQPLLLLAWLIVLGFFIPALLFELSASGIAPLAENHAVRRRTMVIAFFVCAIGLEWFSDRRNDLLLFLPLLALLTVCYFDLSEKPRLSPNLIESLRRRNLIGRFISLFFLPGWPGALLFSLIAIPVAIGIHAHLTHNAYNHLDGADIPLVIFACLGSILIPATFCHLIWRRTHNIFVFVALYNVILSAAASLLSAFAQLTDTPLNFLLVFFPGIPVLYTNLYGNDHPEWVIWYVLGNSVSLILVLCTLGVMSFPYFRELVARLRPQPPLPPEAS